MSTINLYSMDAATGMPMYGKATDIFQTPPIIGMAGAPSVVLANSTIVGTGATYSINGTNTSGRIVLNTGTGISLATGKVMTLTFANGFFFPTGAAVVFSAADANFAGILTRIYANGLTTGAELWVTSLALSVNTTYTGVYTVTGW